jgi:hypothetical protein
MRGYLKLSSEYSRSGSEVRAAQGGAEPLHCVKMNLEAAKEFGFPPFGRHE